MLVENMHGHCWNCGHELTGTDYYRDNHCPGCGKAVHACNNCRYNDPSASSGCREPVADPVSDKTRANFCGYFEPGSISGSNTEDKEDLLKAAEDLFN
ncbi:MAG: hypothetical protein ACWA5Q_02500 [bacterium]